MTAEPAISINGVVRRFNRNGEVVAAVSGVDLDVYAGEITVLAGPSGSGKTTLLSIVARVDMPDSGTIVIDAPNLSLAPFTVPNWAQMAFVPQALVLMEELTIAENIDLPGRLQPGVAGVPVRDLTHLLHIDEVAGRFPSQTSGGEQQRAAVARSLRLLPFAIVADEPTAHQDSRNVDCVLRALREHAAKGNVILISSHDERVLAAADRVVPMR